MQISEYLIETSDKKDAYRPICKKPRMKKQENYPFFSLSCARWY